jgi:hypothetical protein
MTMNIRHLFREAVWFYIRIIGGLAALALIAYALDI